MNAIENGDIFAKDHIIHLIHSTTEPLILVRCAATQKTGVLPNLSGETLQQVLHERKLSLCGILPAVHAEFFGNRAFSALHHLRYPYLVGEMANGIATASMVIAAAKAGMFGCFGAAGLSVTEIEENVLTIRNALGDEAKNWGSNLIYTPQAPGLEEKIVDLYLRLNVTRVSASAYMSLTPAIVKYAASGLAVRDGKIVRRHFIMAKISRPEVAKQFMSPPPQTILKQLLAAGKLTSHEAQLASQLPVAACVTVEADSGGHTDNRPLSVLFPTIQKLACDLAAQYQTSPVFVGAAGGLGTPQSVASAFSLGADYVLTGSINAAAVESGFSEDAKRMLAKADIADVMMAPAADMFELGVKLQILKRGSLFGPRASKLYELYRSYPSIEDIPALEKEKLEKQFFHDRLENIWASTRQFFLQRDPKQIERAESDPKHLMALIFRWYLGKSTRWAMKGDIARRQDYQIWCGPAMGAFNAWVAGSFLEDLSERRVAQIGKNLLAGAAVVMRAHHLQTLGVDIPSSAYTFQPRKFYDE